MPCGKFTSVYWEDDIGGQRCWHGYLETGTARAWAIAHALPGEHIRAILIQS